MFIVATKLPHPRSRGSARRPGRGLWATGARRRRSRSRLSPVLAAVSGSAPARRHRGARRVELGRDRAADHRYPRSRRRAARDDRVGVVRRHRDRAGRAVRALDRRLRPRARRRAAHRGRGATAFGLVDPPAPRRSSRSRSSATHRTIWRWAFDLRLSLLVLFTLAWIAERFDTSALLAGFAAGVMVSFLGEPRRVADQLIGLGEGFFVPLFFVVLGARIDLRALVHSRDDLRALRRARASARRSCRSRSRRSCGCP